MKKILLIMMLLVSLMMTVGSICFAENRTEQTTQLFLKAIEKGDLKTAQAMLDSGADINYNLNGVNAFTNAYYMAFKDYAGITRFLIKNGIDINMRFNKGKTPLMYAITNPYCSFNAFYVLLENGADVNVVDGEGNTALHYAAAHFGNNENGRKFIASLLAKGADINKKNTHAMSPLLIYVNRLNAENANDNSPALAFFKFLLSRGGDVNASVQGDKLIDIAYNRKNIPVYQYLLALEQGKVSVPVFETSKSTEDNSSAKQTERNDIPISEINIGQIAPGQPMTHVLDIYGKPASESETDQLIYVYNSGKFIVGGEKAGNSKDFKVKMVYCYQDVQQTPSGFKVGSSFKDVVKKYGAGISEAVTKNELFYDDYGFKGCKKYYYFNGDTALMFIVDRNQIIKSIQIMVARK